MKHSRKPIVLVAALVIGLCMHASSVWAEAGSPAKVVKDFARAYFMLDPSMASYLSEDARINENEVDTVEHYLEIMAVEARNRGYQTSYFHMRPILMKTEVLNMDDTSAEIRFDAITIRSINPLYRIVGYVFGLVEEHEVQEIITVVKENGEWKIGPGALDLPI